MFTQNNLIMVNGSVKQHKAQIIPRDFSNHTEYSPNTRMDSVWATKEWARAQLGSLKGLPRLSKGTVGQPQGPT
jgi:hypothetical protein